MSESDELYRAALEKAWRQGYAAALDDLGAMLPSRIEQVMADLRLDLDELKATAGRRKAREKLRREQARAAG